MNFPKWTAAVFGIGEVVNKNYLVVLAGAFIFWVACLLLGWIILKLGIQEAQTEIGNWYNPYISEMRDVHNKVSKRKSI